MALLRHAGHACYFVQNFACNQASAFARLRRRQFGRSWTQLVPIMRRHRKSGIERSRATLGFSTWGCAGGCQLVRAAAKPTRCNSALLRGRGRPSMRTEGYSPAELTAPLKSSETPRVRFQARGAFPVRDAVEYSTARIGQYVRRTSGVHGTQCPPFVPKALDRGVDSP